MSKRSTPRVNAPNSGPPSRLPRNALSRIKLGTAFAEYDLTLQKREIFVQTPATLAANDPSRQKYFFVGRRGTGKTATGILLTRNDHHSGTVIPGMFSPSQLKLEPAEFRDPKQRPYHSLVAAFKRTLLEELLAQWTRCCGAAISSMPSDLQWYAARAVAVEFDLRMSENIAAVLGALISDDREWHSQMNVARDMVSLMERRRWASSYFHTLVIDRIDDLWDGSDIAVSYLSALMHAALQLSAQNSWMRVLIFVRENVFERVRAIDPEFARLETSVVGMDWSSEQLMELVERRLNEPFSTRLAIGGPTWSHFFEHPDQAKTEIFDFCQNRPRDVLVYCSFAIENAVAHGHERVSTDDVLEARRRFSDSRLSDLGDEYSENYPRISDVLARFYGLGRRFTLRAISDLVSELIGDYEIQRDCGGWLNHVASPELFTRLLYNIGFVGIASQSTISYRSTGPRDTTPPPLSMTSDVVVHPSYWDALDLQDLVMTEVGGSLPYQRVGLVTDIPEAMSPGEYTDALTALEQRLANIPLGREGAAEFEEFVGAVLRLCFHRSLGNPEAKSRDLSGRVERDWVVSNRAETGFWDVVRTRYAATQVVWECKNYASLTAEDFQQVSYYLTPSFGRFGLIVYRGDPKLTYEEHVRRIASDKDGMVILLTERDLLVFVRQARNGKVKDAHIQDIFDRTVRRIS